MKIGEKIRHPSLEEVPLKVIKKLARHIPDVRLEVNTQRRRRLKLIDDFFERRLLERPGTRARERKQTVGLPSERYGSHKQVFSPVTNFGYNAQAPRAQSPHEHPSS